MVAVIYRSVEGSLTSPDLVRLRSEIKEGTTLNGKKNEKPFSLFGYIHTDPDPTSDPN